MWLKSLREEDSMLRIASVHKKSNGIDELTKSKNASSKDSGSPNEQEHLLTKIIWPGFHTARTRISSKR
jgi:hypothetical protein